MQRRWRLRLSTAVGAVVVAWGALIGLLPLRDNSFVTHLATGRLLWAGEFPRSDPYSFTAAGEPWVVQSWLASLLYAGAERLGGSGGIQVLVIVLTTMLAIAVWLLTSPAGGILVRVGLASMALVVGMTAWSERPLLFGLLGVASVLLVLERRLPPWVLIPVLWVWANTHGSWPLGLVLLVAVLVGARLDGRPQRGERQLLISASIGVLVAVVSPLGLAVWRFPVEMLGQVDVLSNIKEWRSPDFSSLGARVFLVQVLVAVLGLVRQPRYRAALPLCIFVAAALLGARNVPVASLVLVPGTALAWAGVGSVDGRRRSVVATAMAGACAAVVCVLVLAGGRGDPWAWRGYPVASLAWMDEQGLRTPELRLATREYVGNLLTGIDGAQGTVFIDDRYDMYPRAVVDDFVSLLEAVPDWERILDRHEIEAVLWERDQPLSQVLTGSDGWRTVYQDEGNVVVVRRP